MASSSVIASFSMDSKSSATKNGQSLFASMFFPHFTLKISGIFSRLMRVAIIILSRPSGVTSGLSLKRVM
jgi:hypothetical protein